MSGPNAGNAVVGVWSTTERKRLQVHGRARRAKRKHTQGAEARATTAGSRSRASGNPLVNEVVIPLGKKDQFNRTTPDRDAELYGKFVVKPELAAILNALFNVNAPENEPHGHRPGAAARASRC